MPLTPVSPSDRARRMTEDARAAVQRCLVARALVVDALDGARTTQDRCLRQVREHVEQSQTVLERTSGRRRLLSLLTPAGR